MRMAMVAGFLGMLLVSTASAQLEQYVIVKIDNRDGSRTYEMMTRQAFRELEKEIRDDQKYSTRAMMIAIREWKEDESNTKSFPRSAIGRRRATTVGSTYRSAAAAEAKLEKYLDSLNKDDDADEERRRRIREENRRRQMRSGGRGRGGSSQQNSRRYQELKKMYEQKEKEREAEREILYARARELYESVLARLKNPPAESEVIADDL